jgi:hypothetical protein
MSVKTFVKYFAILIAKLSSNFSKWFPQGFVLPIGGAVVSFIGVMPAVCLGSALFAAAPVITAYTINSYGCSNTQGCQIDNKIANFFD